jgi:hypothetical protein
MSAVLKTFLSSSQIFLMSFDTAMKTEDLPTLFSPTNMFKSFEVVNESDLKHLKLSRLIELIHLVANYRMALRYRQLAIALFRV